MRPSFQRGLEQGSELFIQRLDGATGIVGIRIVAFGRGSRQGRSLHGDDWLVD